MTDMVPGRSCLAVTKSRSQTCLQALVLGQLGLLDLCPRCTGLAIEVLERRRRRGGGALGRHIVRGAASVTGREQRLVAALTVLRDQLAPVVGELLAGRLDAEGRALVADALRTVADDLDPRATP